METQDITTIIPYEFNNRTHPEEQINRIANSIQQFGFNQPIVVDENNIVLVGHGRLLAAQKLGLSQIPVYKKNGLTETQKRAYRILDNKLQNDSSWEFQNLELELKLLEEDGFDLPEWGLDDLRSLAPDTTEVQEDDFDADACENVECLIQRGDLIELGAHRLLCGDATEVEDVNALMQGARALLMATDPPYGVAYTDEARVAAERVHGLPARKEKWLGGIDNDQLVDEQIQPFLEKAFSNAAELALTTNAAWYLWHAHLTAAFFAAAAAAAADVLFPRQIVWVKPSLLFGFGDYHWRHECCFYGWRQGHRPEFYGERNQTSVWEVRHEVANGGRVHPTQKPLEVFAIPIKNHTKPGQIVFEPFSGSGSQLIAAEQLGRICYGMEIEPKYCHVIVERYRQYCESNNKTCEVRLNGKAWPG